MIEEMKNDRGNEKMIEEMKKWEMKKWEMKKWEVK